MAEQTRGWGELQRQWLFLQLHPQLDAGRCLTLIPAGVWPSDDAVERHRGAPLSFLLCAEVLALQKQLADNVL